MLTHVLPIRTPGLPIYCLTLPTQTNGGKVERDPPLAYQASRQRMVGKLPTNITNGPN